MATARLDPFARGAISALIEAGRERTEIQERLLKNDGSAPTIRAIDVVLATKRCDPNLRAQESRAGGSRRPLTKVQEKQLATMVAKVPGNAFVTSSFWPSCSSRLPINVSATDGVEHTLSLEFW